MTDGPETRTVDVGGLRLAVSITGSGRPVLLINGLGAGLPMWSVLREDLHGLEVVSFDAPGVGASSTPVIPYTMGDLAKTVTRLLDQLGYDQVDVVGYSFGGAVAQQLARQAPHRVRRVVLVGTMCGWGGIPGTAGAYLAIGTPIRYYSARAYQLTSSLLAGDCAAETDVEFVERTVRARMISRPSVAGYYLQLMAGFGFSSLRWLHAVEHQTLVLSGTMDHLAPPANSHLIASLMPNARLTLIEGWGHLLLMDRGSGAGEKIGEFLRAPELERSRTWDEAVTVSDSDVQRSIRSMPSGSQPVVRANATLRRILRAAPMRR